MKEKLLSISLLVSGREDTTEKCLDSLKPLMEALDCELILVDTGCDETLQKTLGKYTDKIISFTWCNDFAKARNVGLKEAKGQWFMFIDDDEWFEDVSPVIEFFTSGEWESYHQAVYKVRNYANKQGTEYTDEWVSRLIRLEEETHFEGRVHESIVPAKGKCKKIEAFVHHFGYAFESEEERLAHFQRNVALLKELIEEEPENMRWRLQILQEYTNVKDGENLEEQAKSSLNLVKSMNQPFINQCRGAFMSAFLESLLLQEKYTECMVKADEFLAEETLTNAARCSIAKQGFWASVEVEDDEAWERFVKLYFENYRAYEQEELEEQQQIIQESILFVKDAVSENVYFQILNKFAVLMAETGRGEQFPEELREQLEARIKIILEGNGEFLFLAEEIWRMATGGCISLEKMLLELPVSQWMVMVMVLQSKSSSALWEQVRGHLGMIQTQNDIRYDYFQKADASQLLKADVMVDYEMMGEIFAYFAEANLSYARKIYNPEVFESVHELLSKECLAALEIEKMLFCEETDWALRLEYLRNAAKLCPEIGENVKAYAKLLGEEQEKIENQAKEAKSELYIMAKQVKEQVKVMLENGMTEQALPIVKQLRQMLPNDKEILKMEQDIMSHTKSV